MPIRVAKHRVGLPGDSAFREICEKPVQHRAGVPRSG
jgi:hypothetical protein